MSRVPLHGFCHGLVFILLGSVIVLVFLMQQTFRFRKKCEVCGKDFAGLAGFPLTFPTLCVYTVY